MLFFIQIYTMFVPTDPVAVDNAIRKLSWAHRNMWLDEGIQAQTQWCKDQIICLCFTTSSIIWSHEGCQTDYQWEILPAIKSVRNLGITFEPSANLSNHVTLVCRNVKYHLCNIWRVRRFIDKQTCHAAVRPLVLSRPDYCNSLFSFFSQKDLDRLQRLQNSAG